MTASYIRVVLLITIGAFILSAMAFFNQFPLVFSDTGAYINAGWRMEVLIDRPMYYGLFLRHISLNESLFLVVFAQSLILSFLLYHVLRCFISESTVNSYFIPVIGILVALTGVSAYTSILIPDIFTSYIILSVLIFLFGESLGKWVRYSVLIILFYSVIVSLANIITSIGFGFIILLILAGFNKKYSIPWRRILVLFGVVVAAVVFVPTGHYLIAKKFKYTDASHVFLMSRAIDFGILQPYLEEKCKERDYRICAYKDELRFYTFVWDYNSPVFKTGGWEANREEYNEILHEILSDPHYVSQFFYRSIEYSFAQFFSFDTKPQMDLTKTAPTPQIKQRFPNFIEKYLSSRQNTGRLNFWASDTIQWITVILSLAILFKSLVIGNKYTDTRIKAFFATTLFFIYCNAYTSSTFSAVMDRYQGRVVWIIVYLALLMGLRYVDRKREVKS